MLFSTGYAYYGEYPASFAACFDNKEMYDYLIRRGADPNRQDTFGNTVLHLCVIHNKIVRQKYYIADGFYFLNCFLVPFQQVSVGCRAYHARNIDFFVPEILHTRNSVNIMQIDRERNEE